jgi:hypothetical protein
MSVINLESLVLHGSTVVCGGKTGNLRRGTDYATNAESPEIRISMRHPSLGCRQEFQPVMRLRHADSLRVDDVAASGTGRSRSRRSSLRLTTANATTLSDRVAPVAIAVLKRCPAGLAWCKPASKTLPASTWGAGVR